MCIRDSLSGKDGSHGADLFGDLISESVEYIFSLFVTILESHLSYFPHIVCTKISIKSAFTVNLFIDFALCIFT